MADSNLRNLTGGTATDGYTYDSAVGDVYMTLFLKSVGAGQFSQLSQDERQKASEALQEIHAQIGPAASEQAKRSAREYMVENANAFAAPDTLPETMRGLYRVQGITQLGKTLAGAALSIPQIAKGRNILKNNELPDFPQYEKDPAIGNRINEIRRQMEAGDPEQRALLEDQAAQVFRQSRAVSKVTGQTGDFISGSQAAGAAQNRAAREGAVQLSALDRTRQNALDNMLQVANRERMFEHQSRMAEFNQRLYPEFVARRKAGEDLVNAGIQNLYGSVNAGLQAAPMFAAARAYGPQEVPTAAPTTYGRRVGQMGPPAPGVPAAAPSFGVPAPSFSPDFRGPANPFATPAGTLPAAAPSFGMPASSFDPLTFDY